MAQNILVIACGGGLGGRTALFSFFLCNEHGGLLFPYGTAIVNIAGSFMIGLCAAYFSVHADLPPAIRLFAVTGILGGFTTFSTYNLELLTLIRTGHLSYACLYGLLNVGVAFICLFYRYHCGRIPFFSIFKGFFRLTTNLIYNHN